MKLIDTHAHLYADKFEEDIDEVLTRAAEVNEAIFLPNIDQASITTMNNLVARAPDLLYPMMGFHPVYIPEAYPAILNEMEQALATGTYYGVGETGLDLYWDTTTLPRQKASLEVHIEWAKTFQLPIILHARNAIDETYDIIAHHHDERLSGIFHCFDGTLEQAQRIVGLGNFKLGIGGIVTYRKDLPKVLAEIPLGHLVIETDSPYLAPAPHRRTRNESSYTQYVARKLVELYDLPYEEIARITTHNAKEVFKLLNSSS